MSCQNPILELSVSHLNPVSSSAPMDIHLALDALSALQQHDSWKGIKSRSHSNWARQFLFELGGVSKHATAATCQVSTTCLLFLTGLRSYVAMHVKYHPKKKASAISFGVGGIWRSLTGSSKKQPRHTGNIHAETPERSVVGRCFLGCSNSSCPSGAVELLFLPNGSAVGKL